MRFATPPVDRVVRSLQSSVRDSLSNKRGTQMKKQGRTTRIVFSALSTAAVVFLSAFAPSCGGDDDGAGGDAGADASTDTDSDTDTDTDSDTDSDSDTDTDSETDTGTGGDCGDAGTATEVDLPYEFDKSVADGEEPVDLVFTVEEPTWIEALVEAWLYTCLSDGPPMLLIDPDCDPYVDLGAAPYGEWCSATYVGEHGGPVYLDRAGSWTLRLWLEPYYDEYNGSIAGVFTGGAPGFETVEPDSAEAPSTPFAETITSGAFSSASADFGVVLEEGDADWIRAPLYDTRWPIAILNEGAVPGHTAPTRVTAIDPYGDETLLTDDLFALPYLFYFSAVEGEHLLRFENVEPPEDGESGFHFSLAIHGEEFDSTAGLPSEVEPNDTPETAQPLVASGYDAEWSYHVVGALDPEGGDDWFVFTVPEGAAYTTVYARDLFWGLYPSIFPYGDGVVVYEGTTAHSSTTDVFCSGFAFDDLTPGDYIIQVESPPSGYYSLEIATSEYPPWLVE